MERVDDDRYDVAVVGGGPAGLSAAAWAARYRARVLVVDSGEHRNRWVDTSHGYLGLDPVAPSVLLERAREGLLRYPSAALLDGRAGVAGGSVDAFHLQVDGTTIAARRLILCTGVGDVVPQVAGFFRHYGADVFHCPSCDGYEARGRHVLVFGWGEQVTAFSRTLLRWATSVTVVTEGRPLDGGAPQRAQIAGTDGLEVIEGADAAELLGERGALRGVRLHDGRVVACDLAFFTIAHRPHNELATQLGCEIVEEGCVVVDADGSTSVDGVYAAGDLTPGHQLIQVAAAKGTAAGVACAASLHRPSP